MSKIFTDRQRTLLLKTESIKEQVLDEYWKRGKELVDEDVVEAVVKITDSIEKGIERVAKLEILKEKNEIDRQANGNMEAVFKAVHEANRKRREAYTPPTEEQLEYQPTGDELLPGEVKVGADAVDYDTFRKNNPVEEQE